MCYSFYLFKKLCNYISYYVPWILYSIYTACQWICAIFLLSLRNNYLPYGFLLYLYKRWQSIRELFVATLIYCLWCFRQHMPFCSFKKLVSQYTRWRMLASTLCVSSTRHPSTPWRISWRVCIDVISGSGHVVHSHEIWFCMLQLTYWLSCHKCTRPWGGQFLA